MNSLINYPGEVRKSADLHISDIDSRYDTSNIIININIVTGNKRLVVEGGDFNIYAILKEVMFLVVLVHLFGKIWITIRIRGTGMIASSSTFCPHLGRVIRDLFRLLDAVYGIVWKH